MSLVGVIYTQCSQLITKSDLIDKYIFKMEEIPRFFIISIYLIDVVLCHFSLKNPELISDRSSTYSQGLAQIVAAAASGGTSGGRPSCH